MNIVDRIKELENRLLTPDLTPKIIHLFKNSILSLKLEYIKEKIESELTEDIFLSSPQLYYSSINQHPYRDNIIFSVWPINLQKIELNFKECFSLYKKTYFQHQDQFDNFNDPNFNRFVFDKFKSNFSIDDSNKLYQRKKFIIYKIERENMFLEDKIFFSFTDIEPLTYISINDNFLSNIKIMIEKLNDQDFVDIYFEQILLKEQLSTF